MFELRVKGGWGFCCLRFRGWGAWGCFGVGCGQVFRGEVTPRFSLVGLHNKIRGEPYWGSMGGNRGAHECRACE